MREEQRGSNNLKKSKKHESGTTPGLCKVGTRATNDHRKKNQSTMKNWNQFPYQQQQQQMQQQQKMMMQQPQQMMDPYQRPPPITNPEELTESQILEEEIDENYEPNKEGTDSGERGAWTRARSAGGRDAIATAIRSLEWERFSRASRERALRAELSAETVHHLLPTPP